MSGQNLVRTGHVSLMGDGDSEKYDRLQDYLGRSGIWFRKNHHIKYGTYFKSGGFALFYITPASIEELSGLVKFLNEQAVAYRVIGLTSNIMFFDELDYGVIISMVNLCGLSLDGAVARVEAGYSLQDFVRVAILQGAGGFEGLEGIPGTVGGGVFMNAGAYGFSISGRLLKVECIDEAGERVVLAKDECGFSYRDSVFRRNGLIIVAAYFELVKGDAGKIYDTVEAVHIARHSYQEFVYPTLGSMISISSDIYRQIFRNDRWYRNLYFLAKLILKNPVMKFINRRRPRNDAFNRMLGTYISRKTGAPLRYAMSVKGANILVNDGRHTTNEKLDYMELIAGLVGPDFHVENELILDAVISVRQDFEQAHSTIREKYSRLSPGER